MKWTLPTALANHSLLAGLETDILEAILRDVEWFSLPGGSVLFREGDPGDALYLVTSGSLAATIRQRDGADLVVARIRAGETVGEMALISGEPRSATVIAARDCSLVRISQKAFDRLIVLHPAAMANLARLLARRLVKTTHPHGPLTAAKTVALVPTGASVPCNEVAQGLSAHLAGSVPRVRVLDARMAGQTGEWFHAIESAHDLIVYLAEPADSVWTRQCLRQADHIVLVAEAGMASSQAPIRHNLDAMRQRPCDMVVVHTREGDSLVAPAGTALPPVDLRCHVRLGNPSDTARLARLLTGRAVGVVLSSGGARGFAHVGAIRALRASGVPFDLLGGSSMGAIIAAGLAMEWDDSELESRMRDAFVNSNPLRDFTLPLIALLRGREVTRRLRRHFGEIHIEDLWRPYFCVSSNLTTAGSTVHRTGLLWRGLRASVAIPGLLPPVVENGEVLVDGGVIDGLPAGTMRAMGRGPVIGVNVSAEQALAGAPQQLECGSPWRLLGRGGRNAPGIVSLLMRAGTVGSDVQAKAVRGQVDLILEPSLAEVGLLDWRLYRRAIDIGYDHTMRALERLPTPLFRE